MLGAEHEAARLARDARERGLAALRDGDRPAAIRWMERAHRLVPTDRGVALALATACLAYLDRRAEALFREILLVADLREAWMGLATACYQLGDLRGAADALAMALRRYAPAPALEGLADRLVAALELPGWCGLMGSGVPVVRAAPGVGIEMRLDGRRMAGRLTDKGWAGSRELSVVAGDRHLLGSPIDVAVIARVAGCIEPWNDGVRGWAWHPNDPETAPVLAIVDATGRTVRKITAADETVAIRGAGDLARPRGFQVTAARLAGAVGPFRVVGRDGADLLGSPIEPGALERIAPLPVSPKVAPRAPSPGEMPLPADVAIPIHGRPDIVLACLESVLGSVDSRIVVVDDGSQETSLIHALDCLAGSGRIHLLRHDRPLGFPASANEGIAACAGRDVVLLNSDTLVPPGWLERLRSAACRSPDIGTVTPFSNNGSILTYPDPWKAGGIPDLRETIRLDRLAQRANPRELIDIPVGVGFCLYIKRACLNQVGALRADLFAQGYGEENDFCLRARHLGWRHVALPGVFVTHRGGASFGSAGYHLRTRNEPILNRLHPGYSDLIQSFLATDPLAEARRRFDVVRWRVAQPSESRSVVLVTHADGGGVERQVAAAAARYRAEGLRPVLLRPIATPDRGYATEIGDGTEGGFPNLRYHLPKEAGALSRLLRAANPEWVEVHHVLNHPPAVIDTVRRLGVPYDVHVHDYAWICPRISLLDATSRYCGEPDLAGCEACIVRNGGLTGEAIGVEALRRRSAKFLAGARQVVVPSRDTATRMRRYFPDLSFVVVPHSDDTALLRPVERRTIPRVCIAGGIGPHKGYDVLLACARDASERNLRLEFVVVGDTTGDEALLDTGKVFISGTYEAREAVGLIEAQAASLGFVPSAWPETWSLTLTELWQAGLPVAAFDLGAPAERIRATGRGFVLPVGLPPAAINNALLAAIGRASHE